MPTFDRSPASCRHLISNGLGPVRPRWAKRTSTFATGYRYAMLGYTTVMEAAVPPLGARHVLEGIRAS